TPLSGNVLGNDSDSDPGDSLTVSQFVVNGSTVVVPAGPSGGSAGIAGVGSLTLQADGSYRFTPVADWNGSVPTITYTVRDIAGVTASSTLTITVGAVNDPPTANDDGYDTTDTAGPPGGAPINGNVLGNDSDPDAGTALQVVAIDAGAGSVGGNTAGRFGSLTLNADGSFSYAVDQSNASVVALLRGQSLTDTFSYTISDGAGATSTATITVTIHGTNDAPGAGNDHNTIAEEQVSASGNVISGTRTDGSGASSTDPSAQDVDPDGDPLTVVAITLPAGSAGSIGSPFAGAFGAITLAADGSYSYRLDNGKLAVQQLHQGQTLTDSFIYTTTDGRGSFVDATITITITGSNDEPLAVADVNTISEDAAFPATGDVLLNDSDIDSNSTLTVATVSGVGAGAVSGDTSGRFGTLTLHTDGSYDYRLDNGNSVVQALAAGQSLTDSFSYSATDGEGGFATTTLTITIDGENDPPVANADTANTPEDTSLSGNVLANDSDPDAGDTLTISQFVVAGVTVTVPAGASGGSTAIAGVGSLTIRDDGSYSFTPLPDWNGSVPTITYTVRDIAGATSTSTLSITVMPVADITADSISTNSTAPLRFDPLAGSNGATADNFDDPTATVTAVSTPAHGSALVNPDGSISYTPTPGYVGSDSFSYTVSSGGVSETATVNVNVTNAAPVANADTASTPEDTPLSGNVLANDRDPDTGDTLTVSQFVVDGVTVIVPAGPNGGSTAIAGVGTLTLKADGSYSFTPLPDWNGSVPIITYTVSDAAGATSTSTLAITVTPVADHRVPPYVFVNLDPAHWFGEAPIERLVARIDQPFVPAEYVLRQVGRAQDSLAEGVAAILRVQDPLRIGEIQSSLLNVYQTMTPRQFVLDQGVAYSRQLVAELQQRAQLLADRMTLGGESLNDDLSAFSPLNIGAGSNVAEAPVAAVPVATTAASSAELPDAIAAIEQPSAAATPGRPTTPRVASSFSEQLRQSQSQRRRVPGPVV
ncbi:MAG: tandem-95 repeat protein, partial [Rhodobacteraceae bacterium]|nr:tandem-95 repeat protein [Paracoccaceae bacterium]